MRLLVSPKKLWSKFWAVDGMMLLIGFGGNAGMLAFMLLFPVCRRFRVNLLAKAV
jgi:hypothetical protein